MAVMGTRPDTIKMAPVVHALQAHPEIEAIVCVTAQHRQMLDDVLRLFEIEPDIDLDIMTKSQSLTDITTRVLIGMEKVLDSWRPDVVLVHGDTTTSTAAALAAFYQKIPVGHVEAGLRTSSIAEPFPEEANRRLTGVLTSLHFAPTARAKTNLLAERTAHAHIAVTGNTVIDAFLATERRVRERGIATPSLDGLDPARRMIFVTAHRRENHGRMGEIARAVATIADFPEHPQIVWPVHPSPQVAPVVRHVLGGHPGVRLVDPLNYAETVAAVAASRFVLTDSGGLQEEAPTLGKPVLVMRNETERPEGLEAGTLRLIGADYERIVAATRELLTDPVVYGRMAHASNPYGDGRAAERIAAGLLHVLRGAPAPAEFAHPLAAV
ncbi:UDP-N-acetyl glucosamine 2-epimerase [Vulcanimicrobium alpinum]|uniref:UDP-N-acetylglucosamine 2-epimerase (non-hydrolyzing) n=1 Tax=Vulcanimicrobium alpinum TaxID=3016050 RepID=A0AAN1Y0X1_UNVUL|nr:UDP-N-acetylglucosamine 2-epimerase (non-hydrolyzing) [Vulcanimicrobium alpinum]BDE08167.1 UDP-N-acetyl glucosamine 2-epimerase [Vulcanimicrobium alpinum]